MTGDGANHKEIALKKGKFVHGNSIVELNDRACEPGDVPSLAPLLVGSVIALRRDAVYMFRL